MLILNVLFVSRTIQNADASINSSKQLFSLFYQRLKVKFKPPACHLKNIEQCYCCLLFFSPKHNVKIIFLFLISFPIQVLGCCVVAAAVWLRLAYGGYVSIVPQHELLSLDAVVLMGGVVLFIAAFLGCCGAWCKNQCLLICVKKKYLHFLF